MSLRHAKRVGFWAPANGETKTVIGSIFDALSGLPRAEDHIDHEWDAIERQRIYEYVTNAQFRGVGYLGASKCRLCGKWNGMHDFTDKTYVWPEGFGHYINEHGVKPPQDFIDHVLAQTGAKRG